MELVSVKLRAGCVAFVFDGRVEVGVDIAMELPDVDAVILGRRDNHAVIERIEHGFHQWVRVSNECLEEVGHSLLCIIVPHLQEVVLTTSEHVTSVLREVSASDCSFVDRVKFTKVGTVESGQTVDSDSLVLGHDDNFSVVLRELEASDDAANLNLVLQNDRVRAVDH